MAMAAPTVPQRRVQQHLHTTLSFSVRGPRRPSSLRPPNKTFLPSSSPPWKLQHPRLHSTLTPLANADTVSLQEDQGEPSLSNQEDEAYCREILRVLDVLKEKRDMSFNEVRLTILIEDPSEEERREELNIENERGCSREDMAAALVDVYEGKIPSDQTALKELRNEMISWPNLEDEAESRSDPFQSPYAKSTDTGVDPRLVAKKMKVDFDAAAEIQPGEESEDPDVPSVVGFSLLYLVSAVPILIGIGVVAVLYLNSFR